MADEWNHEENLPILSMVKSNSKCETNFLLCRGFPSMVTIFTVLP